MLCPGEINQSHTPLHSASNGHEIQQRHIVSVCRNCEACQHDAFRLGEKAGIERGKLEQSFLPTGKNFGKNEMTAKELVELFEKYYTKEVYNGNDNYEKYWDGWEDAIDWLKSQLKNEKVRK